jgi:UPF0755 protein
LNNGTVLTHGRGAHGTYQNYFFLFTISSMKKLLFVIFVLFVLCVLSWYKLSLRPVNVSSTINDIVTIPAGASTAKIAEILKEKNLIRSTSVFTLYTRLHGEGNSLQAGSFSLSQNMNVPKTIDVLRGKVSAQSIITIPEGFTVRDIDHLLASKNLIKEGDFVTCAQTCDFSTFAFLPKPSGVIQHQLEGFLFPDTYFVAMSDFTAQSFAERLLQTFEKRVLGDLKADLAVSKRSLAEIVTMASLLEEEARNDDERAMVAGILWKRLDAKTGLDVDATIRYALNKKREALTRTDLETDSPYNTRKYRGLPPGPIANPGLASIKAALAPKESPYWYYLHDRQGLIHYAVTNDEHNENKVRYLQ